MTDAVQFLDYTKIYRVSDTTPVYGRCTLFGSDYEFDGEEGALYFLIDAFELVYYTVEQTIDFECQLVGNLLMVKALIGGEALPLYITVVQ